MQDIPRTYVDNAIAWAKSQLGNTDYRGNCLVFLLLIQCSIQQLPKLIRGITDQFQAGLGFGFIALSQADHPDMIQ